MVESGTTVKNGTTVNIGQRGTARIEEARQEVEGFEGNGFESNGQGEEQGSVRENGG